MTLVTRPGGGIAALEFDLETLFLDHQDAELTEAIWTSYLSHRTGPAERTGDNSTGGVR
jgi:hypothetical protein